VGEKVAENATTVLIGVYDTDEVKTVTTLSSIQVVIGNTTILFHSAEIARQCADDIYQTADKWDAQINTHPDLLVANQDNTH